MSTHHLSQNFVLKWLHVFFNEAHLKAASAAGRFKVWAHERDMKKDSYVKPDTNRQGDNEVTKCGKVHLKKMTVLRAITRGWKFTKLVWSLFKKCLQNKEHIKKRTDVCGWKSYLRREYSLLMLQAVRKVVLECILQCLASEKNSKQQNEKEEKKIQSRKGGK